MGGVLEQQVGLALGYSTHILSHSTYVYSSHSLFDPLIVTKVIKIVCNPSSIKYLVIYH